MIKPKLFLVLLSIFTVIAFSETIVSAQYHHVDGCNVCHSFQDGACSQCPDNIKGIRCTISTPNSGPKTVVFLDNDGPFPDWDYADGDTTYDGVCEVCHTAPTKYYRNDGSGDVHPEYTIGGVTGGGPGTDCISCHKHVPDEFSHGGVGTGCGTSDTCHGAQKSHPTHVLPIAQGGMLEADCDACHDTNNFPLFADGNDLSTTTACDTCHSQGGTYDGVNDPDLGAKYGNDGELKYNWSNRPYNDNGSLKAGMEKWCATCHDESPSEIQGVDAPNVIGDEGYTTNYGVGYGFYKTGHGLPENQYYPASGGTIPGAGVSCDYCHDFTMKHIDGVARTYVYTATEGNDDDYQHGYRLKSINGLLPMDMPRIDGCESGVEEADFRLCFSCHDSGPFTSASNYDTNFRRTDTPDQNAHYIHLAIQDSCDYGPVFHSDWDSSHSYDSRASCVTCHNVHGSEQLSMVRDGRLVGRTGQEVLYYKPGVSYSCGNYPDSRNVPVHESTGTVYAQNNGLCSTCHGSCGFDSVYLRTPFDNTPPRITKVQGEVGSDSLAVSFSESVYSDLNEIGFLLIEDFALTDSDDSRMIGGVTHVAGDNSATVSLNFALDGTNDIGTDTLAAATTTSIYDENNYPMDTSPVIISDAGIATQMIIHPSGLDSTANCSPAGGVWADILDTDDGASTYADCYSVNEDSGPSPAGLTPAWFKVDMDDPAGLTGAVINHLTVRAVVDLTGLTGGTYGYLQVCYETGGASQECGVQYELTGTEGYVDILVGSNVDPDGNPFDLSDLNNLQVEVKLEAESCCGDSDATAYVTEVYAEVDYIIPADDTDPPVLSNQDPANGTTGIDIYSDLTFTISDSGNEIDWNTFGIELTGDKGYSKSYTDADFTIVTKTGYPGRYDVTVNPDVDFGELEVITVTVHADDFYGNALVHPTWSFTADVAAAPQVLNLHPSGVNHAGAFTTSGGTGWSDVLDSNDGLTSHAHKCGGAGYPSDPTNSHFRVDIDDSELSGESIQGIEIGVVTKYAPSCPTSGTASGLIDICYKTGTATSCTTDISVSGDFSTYTTNHTVDSDGGSLDVADIDNIQIEVRRRSSGSIHLIVTEVYVNVTYQP